MDPPSRLGHHRPVEPELARTLWHRLEGLNAVAYFSAECLDAPAAAGLKGFWMGYFGCRSAPLGPVGPAVVEATFFNFHPARVRRAIPDVWAYARPGHLLDLRSAAAAASLRRILSGPVAERLAEKLRPMLQAAIDRADSGGRPLFAANRDVVSPDDPVAALWQAATTLREHRGDGHVALLAGSGLDGCEAHVLFAAVEGVEPELFLQSRGWSSEDWQAAVDRLIGRGVLDQDGRPSPAGHQLRQLVERRTDELAIRPYEALGDDRVDHLLRLLDPPAARVTASGDLTFPNPMGLPASPQ